MVPAIDMVPAHQPAPAIFVAYNLTGWMFRGRKDCASGVKCKQWCQNSKTSQGKHMFLRWSENPAVERQKSEEKR